MLVPMHVTVQEEVAILVDTIAISTKEPLAPSLCESPPGEGLPTQADFGIHLVDVLPTWTTAADRRPAEFVITNDERWRNADFRHDTKTLQWRLCSHKTLGRHCDEIHRRLFERID